MDTQWFAGDEPRDAAEVRFLDQLRRRAVSWDVHGLTPQHTATISGLAPLHVSVAVPGLAPETTSRIRLTNLQVGYWQRGPYGEGLQGEWGDDYLLDNHRHDTNGLTVIGIQAEPEDFANWTADWFWRQLNRPRERQEWVVAGKVVTSRTRLADTGLVLFTEGSVLPRMLRRSPDRVVPVSVE